MKRSLLVLLLTALCLTVQTEAFAQSDTLVIEEEEAPLGIAGATRDSRDRLILELNWNYLLGTPDSFNIQGQSRGFNFYLYYDILLGSENWAFAPGVGMSMPNYFHKSQLMVDSAGITTAHPYPDSLDVKKTKIGVTYFEIPVEFRYRTKRNAKGNRFKIAIGFKAGVVMATKSKYVGEENRPDVAYREDGENVKYKSHRLLNIERFRYGPTLRFGYGNVNIQAYYGLADLFTDEGPKGTPLAVGISFNPF